MTPLCPTWKKSIKKKSLEQNTPRSFRVEGSQEVKHSCRTSQPFLEFFAFCGTLIGRYHQTATTTMRFTAALCLLAAASSCEAFTTSTSRPVVRVVPPSTLSSAPRQRSLAFGTTPLFSTKDKSSSKKKDSSSVSYFEAPTSNRIQSDPIPYSELTIGVLKEVFPGENRVSQTPDTVNSLVSAGFNVIVQSGGACVCFRVACWLCNSTLTHSFLSTFLFHQFEHFLCVRLLLCCLLCDSTLTSLSNLNTSTS